jgi:hypothetical protein
MTGPRKPREGSGGIVISGSSVQGSAFATGDNSRAEVRSTNVWHELSDLRRALRDAGVRGDLDAGALRAAEERVADVDEAVAGVRDAGEAAQRVIGSIPQGGGRS